MRGKKEKLLKTSGADVLSSRKKLKKNRRLKQNAFVCLRPDEEICYIYAHWDKTGNKYDGDLNYRITRIDAAPE